MTAASNSEARKRLAAPAMTADEHDHGPTAQLLGDAWCLTCHHTHIATIPSTTFRCSDCGFGAWGETVAAAHAWHLPDHIVHPVLHQMVEEHPPAPDAEALAEALSWTSGEFTRYSETAHDDHNRWSWRGDGHGPAIRQQFLEQAEALAPLIAERRRAEL